MPPTMPWGLTQEDSDQIDRIFANEELVAFMSSGISNTGNEEPQETLEERAKKSIKAFEKYSPSWWKKNG